MAKPFKELIKHWPAERRARVEARAKALIDEEMTLRDLRRARALTQVQISKTLGIGQEHVSRLEKKSDMLLSTLANYVRAMGGDLHLTAAFPDRPPVKLSNLADVFADEWKSAKPARKRRKASPRKAA
jgi:transcriptional regulator with XRE-family HTH domain